MCSEVGTSRHRLSHRAAAAEAAAWKEASEPLPSFQRGATGRCDEPRTPEVMQKHGRRREEEVEERRWGRRWGEVQESL